MLTERELRSLLKGLVQLRVANNLKSEDLRLEQTKSMVSVEAAEAREKLIDWTEWRVEQKRNTKGRWNS